MAVFIRCSVLRSGTFISGCHCFIFATLCCRRFTCSFQSNILSPSFFTAEQMMSITSSLSASWMGLLSMTNIPMRLSLCIRTIPALLSHEILVYIEVGRSLMLTGAERNTFPFLPTALSEAMASQVCVAMGSSLSMNRDCPPDNLKLPMLSRAIAIRSGYAEAIRLPTASGSTGWLSSFTWSSLRYSCAICAMRAHLPKFSFSLCERSMVMRRVMSESAFSLIGSFSSKRAAMSQAKAFWASVSEQSIILAIRGWQGRAAISLPRSVALPSSLMACSERSKCFAL